MLEALLAAGANPDARIRNGRTPLHYAVNVLGGGPAAVEALVAARANREAQNDWGETPLHDAATNYLRNARQNADYVEALIAAGANLEVRDRDGDTRVSEANRFVCLLDKAQQEGCIVRCPAQERNPEGRPRTAGLRAVRVLALRVPTHKDTSTYRSGPSSRSTRS